MSAEIASALIGAGATVAAAAIAYFATHRKDKVVHRERWYTRWIFNPVLHESLDLNIAATGQVTGTRTTTPEGGVPNTFVVTGYKQGSFYWLEYHVEDKRGGGAVTLQEFTPGQLIGLVTSVHCDGIALLCRSNRWVAAAERSKYKNEWFATVARVPAPGPEPER